MRVGGKTTQSAVENFEKVLEIRESERVRRDLKETIYEEKAKAWLENKPEAKSAEYFACTGCHVE